jgi:hypothetical protein
MWGHDRDLEGGTGQCPTHLGYGAFVIQMYVYEKERVSYLRQCCTYYWFSTNTCDCGYRLPVMCVLESKIHLTNSH